MFENYRARGPASTKPPAIEAVPGWYPDPEGDASLRWWNGLKWTDCVSEPLTSDLTSE